MSIFEVHDIDALANARAIMNLTESPREWAAEVVKAVDRNDEWRGKSCLNLLAPEAPTSPTVRRLLSSEIGTRAAEGHIGRVNRWFA
ncbi:MAG: serine hydroxymethyltransferase, partial [Chloroflexota bacterium]